MKAKEMIREELHEQLCKVGVQPYILNMTELLSQAYSLGSGVFDALLG
jgi:hypothetical protein